MRCTRCGFESPPGFAFCGKCGAKLSESQEQLLAAELEHLRTYLPATLIEALQYDLAAPPPRLLESCVGHLARLLETTGTHLPAFLVEELARNPAPGQAGGQFVEGTLLFADISGFTAISERLSRIGREGTEEVTAIVNRYFEQMLSILRSYGGQLIKFGGDALLGLFLEPDSARRAGWSALAMQAAMQAFAQTRTSQGDFPLKMKVAIRRGRFFAARLGDASSMEYALFGADVRAAAAAEGIAAAGQVLLDQATLQACQAACTLIPLPGHPGFWLAEADPAHPPPPGAYTPSRLFPAPQADIASLRRLAELLDALTPYLPAGLLPRLASDPQAASLEGEHRLAATLFARLGGLAEIADGLGPGQEGRISEAINIVFRAMTGAIQRYGGVVNKIDLAEHGDKLVVLFGAPVAHEDDAERAVRAALELHKAMAELRTHLPASLGLPELDLSLQIGISYGYVFAGYVGAGWRHEYTVMGDEVNLAARLMELGQGGQVIVGRNIRRKTQAIFELAPGGEVLLRGKTLPEPVFSVSGLRAVPEPLRGLQGMRSPLVGRQAEWQQLLAAVEQLRFRRGQIVSITGEAGLGKSRLVAELRQRLAAPGGDGPGQPPAWFEGRCLSYTETASFWPFQELVRRLVGLPPGEEEAYALPRLRVLLERFFDAGQVNETLPFLANFLSLPLDESLQMRIRYLEAEALQRRTFMAIRSLLEAQARAGPAVVVLEDIHWIDQASALLLEHLLQLVNQAPVLLILLYRPERAKRCWQIHEKARREYAYCYTEIPLHALDASTSQEMLANLVGVEAWPADLRQLILSRTEGNPLYLEEIIRSLINDGALVQQPDGKWALGSAVDASQVPDTLQGVIMARLDRLEEPCRWTAQVASVVGRLFAFDVLAHITAEYADRPVNACLVQLQQHEVVRETQRIPEITYIFKHTLVQEVCYTSLPLRARRDYHRKIASYLESSLRDGWQRAEIVTPLVAHHAFAGQDWPRALDYQILAGRQSQKLFANQEAIEHFQVALACAENLPAAATAPARLAAHLALGELLTISSRYEQARDHLLQADSLAVSLADADSRSHACRWLARLHELRGEYPQAFEWIEGGLAALGGRQTAEAAQLHINAGLIYTRLGDLDSAVRHSQTALEIANRLGELAALARANNLLGVITRNRGDNLAAAGYFQTALELYRQAGDIHGQAITHNLIANACFNTGGWQDASHHYRQARQIFDQIGDVYNRVIADNNLGGIALNQGRVDEAVAFYQQALASLEQIGGSAYVLGIVVMNLGAAFIRKGRADQAREHLHISQNYFGQAKSRDFLPEMHRHLARAALIAGEPGQAEAQCQEALRLARELSMRSEEGCCLRVLGEIAREQGRLDQARTVLEESVHILQEIADEYELARSQFSLARVYAALGLRPQARELMEQCTGVFRRLEAAMDLLAAEVLVQSLDGHLGYRAI